MHRCECGRWTTNEGDCHVCVAGKAVLAKIEAGRREREARYAEELPPHWKAVYDAVTAGFDPRVDIALEVR